MDRFSAVGVVCLASLTAFFPSRASAQNVDLSSAAAATPGTWPKAPQAPTGAPNVVLILVDDAGFSATQTFGGEAETPNFSKLAAKGLRYNAFAVNSICSPTRAALLSGRNSHEVGFGIVTDRPSPYPGYDCYWPKSAASIAEVLKENGYATAAFGKWHNTPFAETSPVGPFDRWPTSLGFEHFYGFLNGWDNQYVPRLMRNTTPVEPPATAAEGYNFTYDITDEAIRWMHEQEAVNPAKPFFVYFATGATHWPLQVPKEWIAKYKGRFDAGWDVMRAQTFARQKKMGIIPANAVLTPRPAGLPAWDSVTPDEKKLLAHQAEVYSAYAEQADHEIGRLLDTIGTDGKADNTLVIEIFGDNGGSAEGGLLGRDAFAVNGKERSVEDRLQTMDDIGSDTFIDYYAAAWAWEQSTPFQGTKLDASHLGGTRDPMVLSWPARVKDAGGLRTQFQHITDIAPTIYEAAEVSLPKAVDGVDQMPLEGESLLYTIDHPDAPSRHHLQYFAAEGNIGIYQDGWWAGRLYQMPYERHTEEDGTGLDRHPWELYHLTDDYSQGHDLAAAEPAKLKEMEALFDTEAKRNNVYPLTQGKFELPSPADGRKQFVYRAGVDRLTDFVVPLIAGRSHTLTADVVIPAGDAHGVLVAQGGRYGGFTLFVRGGHAVYEVNAYGNRSAQLVSADALKPGPAHIVVAVAADEKGSPVARGGKVAMQINGVNEGEKVFPNLVGKQHGETLDIGKDLGSPVSADYAVPFAFNGSIDRVTVEMR
jgi:arylsulfatase A-like enzyme